MIIVCIFCVHVSLFFVVLFFVVFSVWSCFIAYRAFIPDCSCWICRLYTCKIQWTAFEYTKELSYLNFWPKFKVIRKKWMELSPNPSFILKVIDFSNSCNNFFYEFWAYDFAPSTKFLHVFQFSFKTHYLLIFVYRKWCEAQLRLCV